MAGDPYFYNVQLLLHADFAPLLDSSYYARNVLYYDELYGTITANNTAQTGFTAAYFSYGYQYIGLKKNAPVFNVGTSDFTFEMFVNPYSGGHYYNGDSILFQLGPNYSAGMLRLYAPTYASPGYLRLQGHDGYAFVQLTPTTPPLPNNAWRHVAVTRSGNVWSIWINGLLAATSTVAYTVNQSTLYLFCDSAGSYGYSGGFDDVRFTVGVARYTADFTPPTEPFPDRPDIWQYSFNDTIAVGNEGLGYRNQYTDAVSDSFSAADLLSFVWGVQWADAAQLTDPPNTKMPVVLSDRASVSDVTARNMSQKGVLTDAAAIEDLLVKLSRPGAVVLEPVKLAEVLAAAGKYRLSSIDVAAVADSLIAGRTVSLTDAVALQAVLLVQRAVAITEALGIKDVWAAVAKFGLTQIDRVAVADALRRFFGGEAVESVTVGSTLDRTTRLAPVATETIGMASVLANKLTLRLVSTDSFEMTDMQALKALFRPSVLDEVELSAAFVNPDGSVTTWAVNAITGAVTQYDNYAFNSFARFGQTYVAADENGLYELNGCSDDGEAIVATIRSGLAQLTASRFTMIRDAYLGIRGDGSFILRIRTGEGESYDYKFDAQNMKTTRVQLGKGMRARYISFELIGDGEDFDLESVEFIPLMSQRRV